MPKVRVPVSCIFFICIVCSLGAQFQAALTHVSDVLVDYVYEAALIDDQNALHLYQHSTHLDYFNITTKVVYPDGSVSPEQTIYQLGGGSILPGGTYESNYGYLDNGIITYIFLNDLFGRCVRISGTNVQEYVIPFSGDYYYGVLDYSVFFENHLYKIGYDAQSRYHFIYWDFDQGTEVEVYELPLGVDGCSLRKFDENSMILSQEDFDYPLYTDSLFTYIIDSDLTMHQSNINNGGLSLSYRFTDTCFFGDLSTYDDGYYQGSTGLITSSGYNFDIDSWFWWDDMYPGDFNWWFQFPITPDLILCRYSHSFESSYYSEYRIYQFNGVDVLIPYNGFPQLDYTNDSPLFAAMIHDVLLVMHSNPDNVSFRLADIVNQQ
jgi:hypothetical protein